MPGYPSLEGRFILKGDDTLITLDGPSARPVSDDDAWCAAVISVGRSKARPGIFMTDANAFLSAVRDAAARQ